MAFTVHVIDNASPHITRLVELIQSKKMRSIMGRSVQQEVRSHLFNKDRTEPNQLGGKRTHFYGQAARSTRSEVEFDGFSVSVNHVGIRQRLRGGTIRPVKAKWLTIPAIPEAHGKRAREFGNLKFVWLGRNPALVEVDATTVKRGKKGFRSEGETGGLVFYWLKKSVHQKGDPTVIPTNKRMAEVAVDSAESALRMEVK